MPSPSDRTLRPADREQLAEWFSLEPRELRRTWLLHVTLGELAGFAVPALAAVLLAGAGAFWMLAGLVVAGAVEGAVLGAAQARVLRREFLGFHRRAWVVATTVGAAVAWLLGMLPSTLHDTWSGWPMPVVVLAGAVVGTGLLLSIGIAQHRVLRHHVDHSRRWIAANAIAWAAGLSIFAAVTTPLWRDGQEPWLVAVIGLGGGLAMAAVMAWVTGWFLLRLVAPATGPGPHRPPYGAPEGDWDLVGGSTDRFLVFDPASLDRLPDPVQRWMRHALTPGHPLLTAAEVDTDGQVLLNRAWHGYRAHQRISLHRGFVWAARTRLLGLPVRGYDRYTHHTGEMCWRLPGRFALVDVRDEEVTASARGRLFVEALAMLPATALDPTIRWEAVDETRAVARALVGGDPQQVTVSVGPTGRLLALEMRRWGAPPGCGFGLYRYGAVFGAEGLLDGCRVPTQVTAGWHYGTERWNEGVTIRYRVTGARFH